MGEPMSVSLQGPNTTSVVTLWHTSQIKKKENIGGQYSGYYQTGSEINFNHIYYNSLILLDHWFPNGKL